MSKTSETSETSETRKADKTDCDHRLLYNLEDETTLPHWDCIRCGAVAFFDPSKRGMRVPRPS